MREGTGKINTQGVSGQDATGGRGARLRFFFRTFESRDQSFYLPRKEQPPELANPSSFLPFLGSEAFELELPNANLPCGRQVKTVETKGESKQTGKSRSLRSSLSLFWLLVLSLKLYSYRPLYWMRFAHRQLEDSESVAVELVAQSS